MEQKLVYAYNKAQAFAEFRAWMKETGSLTSKYVPVKAVFAGTKHNMKVYAVYYRKTKKMPKGLTAWQREIWKEQN